MTIFYYFWKHSENDHIIQYMAGPLKNGGEEGADFY